MTNRRYAQGTEVPIGRSRDEIERTLERFDATGQIWARDDERQVVTVAFKRGRHGYKFTVALPPLADFMSTPSGKWERTQPQAQKARDGEIRRLFRSLANYIKAMLDATDSGIIDAEEALLPFLMLPTGETVYQRAQVQLANSDEVDLSRALKSG